MDKNTVKIVSTVLGVSGIILILMMAFNILPGKGNILIFAGIVCFIIAGVIRSTAKKQK